jgi:hypothetical protein
MYLSRCMCARMFAHVCLCVCVCLCVFVFAPVCLFVFVCVCCALHIKDVGYKP